MRRLDLTSNCSRTPVDPGSRLIEFGKANADDLRILEDVLWRQNPATSTSRALLFSQLLDVADVADAPFY